MSINLVLMALLLLIGGFWYKSLDVARQQQVKKYLIPLLIAGLAVIMTLTGRFNILSLLITLSPLLLTLNIDSRKIKDILSGMNKPVSTGQGSGAQSRASSQYLSMTLDHKTQTIDGKILSGRYQGKILSDLNVQQLLSVLKEFGHDQDTYHLLTSYLDRNYHDWQQQFQQHTTASSIDMSLSEAYDVLGISDNASPDQIITAHRKLMQKLHPDRGGSSYLAAKVNHAKDLLINQFN